MSQTDSQTDPGGYSTFGLDRGVPLGILKWHTCKYQFWRKIDPSIYQKSQFFHENLHQNGANFGKFWKVYLSKYQICAILAQILENFEKLTHQSTTFFKEKGPIDVPGGLILLPMFAAHPYNHFCTEYPPETDRQTDRHG